ncbi:triphosphoribosyl-dephospho-CoA synthase [Paraburkholderia phenazinium]|uniref:Probable 2-(5''-triphosphoribosyl)-3'-dephosphocoenzyme-A synthase n=1 Tax=Paraburkholderia phenazinium TaxID=60549 RepID=A0A1G8G9E0_9BURK|nr:triphosphoribosyl-dephospho-CoA synthase [Paraburkholderia phenazinium]SDH91002.1 triphosphoribosyl-dephospho-CoA synthase [Paraburkholderia phenazinium]
MATPALLPVMPTRGSSAFSAPPLTEAQPRATRAAAPAIHAAQAAQESAADAWLAQLAVTALIEEAQLTPKPALVDRRGSGAHRDLDLAIMLRSAHALEPTFAELARAARRSLPSATLRAELAQIGRAGEHEMMRATGGSNAHRGAIWIVGLLVAGAALAQRDGTQSAARHPNAGSHAQARAHAASRVALAMKVCTLAAQIACFPDRFAAAPDSNGERARQRYQVGGARREAQDGFPHVIAVGLPALLAARANDMGEDAARLDALLAIMSSLDDTCLLHRAGLPGLHAGQQGARRVLELGGSATAAGRTALAELDRALLALNASPGGAADLLAATLFIDMLVHRDTSGSQTSWNI